MPTIFTKIIAGELPGRFVWKDEHAVAFLTIHPIRPGHTLVVPRAEIDHWLDLPPELNAHLAQVAQAIGKGLQQAFRPTKVGLMIAGLEVPHVHLHCIPVDELGDLDFRRQNLNATPPELDHAAQQLRLALRTLGFAQATDS